MQQKSPLTPLYKGGQEGSPLSQRGVGGISSSKDYIFVHSPVNR
jgi:hypothetical protein